jgi:putative transcriptional regulator
MPTRIDIEPALLKWQAKHKKRLTYEELANLAGISIAALYRMKSGDMITPDLRKINQLCKVLECEPGELILREQTGDMSAATELEVLHREVMHEHERRVANKRRKKIAISVP